MLNFQFQKLIKTEFMNTLGFPGTVSAHMWLSSNLHQRNTILLTKRASATMFLNVQIISDSFILEYYQSMQIILVHHMIPSFGGNQMSNSIYQTYTWMG